MTQYETFKEWLASREGKAALRQVIESNAERALEAAWDYGFKAGWDAGGYVD